MKAVATVSLAAVASLAGLGAAGAESRWTSDYQMGAFVAGGGSDEEGWITLECVDPESGAPSPGTLSLSLTPQTGVDLATGDSPDLLAFWVDEAGSIPIPVHWEGESLVMDEIGASLRRSLLTMLRVGDTLWVRTAERDAEMAAEISLAGSTAALAGFEACTEVTGSDN